MSEPVKGAGDQGRHRGVIADVGGHEDGRCALVAQLGRGGLAAVGIDVGEHDADALLRTGRASTGNTREGI